MRFEEQPDSSRQNRMLEMAISRAISGGWRTDSSWRFPHRQLTGAAEAQDNLGAQRKTATKRWPAVTTDDSKDRRPFSTAGQKLDETISDAAKRIEAETKHLIDYINDEVVPMVRQHSTTGLRVASDKLKEFADYMESTKKEKP
jgi:hypothetical protein